MPIIKSISDLRNKANRISDLAHHSNEPVFITKNGEGDLVVMSLEHYSQIQLKLQIYSKLAAAQSEIAAGGKGRSFKSVLADIRQRVREAAFVVRS